MPWILFSPFCLRRILNAKFSFSVPELLLLKSTIISRRRVALNARITSTGFSAPSDLCPILSFFMAFCFLHSEFLNVSFHLFSCSHPEFWSETIWFGITRSRILLRWILSILNHAYIYIETQIYFFNLVKIYSVIFTQYNNKQTEKKVILLIFL